MSAHGQLLDGFRFYLEGIETFQKDATPKCKSRLGIRGVATCDVKDRVGDTVDQEGMDWSSFLKFGWFNWDHDGARKDADGNTLPGDPELVVVGYPTMARFFRKGAKLPSGKTMVADGWYVEGYLLDDEMGRKIYAKAEALEGTGRFLGFSVQGGIAKRIGSRIVRSIVSQVAISFKQANPEAYLELIKTIDAGGGAVPLHPTVRQSLDPVLHITTYEAGSGCVSRDEFERDRGVRKLTKSAYTAAIRGGPGGIREAFEKAYKGEPTMSDLAKTTQELSDVLGGAEPKDGKPSDPISADPAIQQAVNVTPFLKGLVDQLCQSLDGMGEDLKGQGRIGIAQGRLVKAMADEMASMHAENVELKGQIESLEKAVAAWGDAPLAARKGATDLRAVPRVMGAEKRPEALAKTADGADPEPDGDSDDEKLKGMKPAFIKAKLEKAFGAACKAGDKEAQDDLQKSLTAYEGRGFLTKTARAVALGA